jgi:iron complex transport system substrate-binding protein
VLLLFVALLLTAAATACGSTATDATPGGSAVAAAPGPGDFPVTLTHKYGDTTVAAAPKRIVTVGLTDQDSVIALGATPVGTTEWFGQHPGALWPWAARQNKGAVPEVVGDASAIGFEKVASLQPDLILAVYSGLTHEDYDKLTQIAPTVAQPGNYVDYGVPWDEQTLTIGTALGQPERARAIVESVQAKFTAATGANPGFKGATGLVASKYSDSIAVYAPEDGRGRLMSALGFVQPPEIASLAGKEFSATISAERIDLLNADALVWIVNSIDTDVPKYDADPLYSALDVHTGKHDVFVENLSELGGGLSFVTVLSLPPVLDQLVPKLATAVKGGS